MPEANTLYEAMYIINPGLTPEEVDQVVGRIENHITENGGELVGTRDFGRRHLAYKIGHQSEGIYKIAYFRGTGAVVDEVKHEFLLTETIVRGTVFLSNPDCYVDEFNELVMPTTGTRGAKRAAEEAAAEESVAPESVVEEPVVEEPVDEVAEEVAPVEEAAEAAPVEEVPVAEEAVPIAEPVAVAPVEEPAEAAQAPEPVAEAPVEEPVAAEPVAEEPAEVAEVPAQPGEEPKTEDEPGPAAA